MSSLKLIAALIVAAVLVVFGAQNTQAVTFHFLMFNVPSMPMVLALFAAALVGALLGWIVSAPGRFRGLRQRRGLQSQVAAHERAAAATTDANHSNSRLKPEMLEGQMIQGDGAVEQTATREV